MTNLLAEAVAWYNAGYMPVPVRADGSKAPGVNAWRDWQDTRPPLGTVVDLFTRTDTDGIGLLCGATSGQLEMLELEGRAVEEGYLDRLATAFADHGLEALWERIETGYAEQTPSGGLHWYYRVDGPAARNTKLARRPATEAELEASPEKAKVLIETRGQGGFTVIAPSAGRTHKSGAAWQVIAGTREAIPTLSVEERDTLFEIANLLDEMPAVEWAAPTDGGSAAPAPAADELRPGDDYNNRATWADLLQPRGWTLAHRWPSGRLGWTRPGKHPRDGLSATSGGAADGVDRLYVFSSSTEFEPEKPYTKFSAYALLEHGGDFAAATRALRAAGYGSAPRPKEPEAGPALTLVQGGGGGAPVDGTAAVKISQDGSDLPAVHTTTYTDQGNADLLATRYGAQLRYVPARKEWIEWDGLRWRWCEDVGEVTQAAVETIRAIKPESEAQRQHKTKSLSRRAIEAQVTLASRHAGMRTAIEALDADPWILNTPSGIVDLRTGAVRPSTPDDNCTRITGCPYSPGTAAPRWSAFLDETFGGDPDMIGFVQRLAGYSALGLVTHHVLPFLHGSGGNGKGVFVETMIALLGDYASTAPQGFLLQGRNDESAVARLAGLRLVASSEVNQSAKFDEAKVKLLTGGDSLTSRFLYGKYFTFKPSHTLWILGNHQPRVEAGGDSFWRRLRLVPFTRTVPDEKKIEGLAEMLVESEGPAILGWVVAGALDVLRGGLREPGQVMAATKAYAEEEDAIARFVSDRLHVGGGQAVRVNTSEVRSAYAKWCRAEGEAEVSPQAFGRELRSRWGIEATRSNGARFYVGVTLLSDSEEPEDDDPRATAWDQR